MLLSILYLKGFGTGFGTGLTSGFGVFLGSGDGFDGVSGFGDGDGLVSLLRGFGFEKALSGIYDAAPTPFYICYFIFYLIAS